MLSIIGSVLTATVFGGRSGIKAIASGVGAAGAVIGSAALGACDLETVGSQIGAAIGAYVLGHTVTWLSPANRRA